MNQEQYEALLKEEARQWGSTAEQAVRRVKPDWTEVQHLPHHAVLHGRHISRLLSMIKPGWRILEIGCSSGWLSLEMARRGAYVEGIDVADSAIQIARLYAAENPPAGRVEYRVADINYLPLPEQHYDLIVALGVLHHLVEVEAVLDRVRKALRPSGILFVADSLDTPSANAWVAGALFLILPTRLTYRDKFGQLLKLRGNAGAHLKDSIEAKGLSPFEGYGRHQEPERLIREKFNVSQVWYESAFVGYIIAQLNLPDQAIIAIGRSLSLLDRTLVKLRLLQGLSYTLIATAPTEAILTNR